MHFRALPQALRVYFLVLLNLAFLPLNISYSASGKKPTVNTEPVPLKKPVRVFLDSGPTKITQVFQYSDADIKNPKHLIETTTSCEKNEKGICKNANGWLTTTAEVEVVSEPFVKKYFNTKANEEVNNEYVRVRFRYAGLTDVGPDGYRYGYLPTSTLTKNASEAFFATATAESPVKPSTLDNPCKKPNCPLDPKIKSKADDLNAIVEAERKAALAPMNLTNQSVDKAVDLIAPLVGKCVRKTPKQIEDEFQPKENIYRKVLAPIIQKQEIPKGLDLQSSPTAKPEAFTHKHLEAIDAAARTIYAEMGSCFDNGLQYPMGVGRIIINRAEATCSLKDAVFIQGEHDPKSLDITKVATTPQQFSLWLRQEGIRKKAKNGKERIGPLRQALCPPSNASDGYYGGEQIPETEKDIWRNSLRLATELVMYVNSYKNKTHELKARYYYTSNVGWFHGMKRVYPKIMGRALDDHRCMEIWQNLKRDIECNKGEMTEFDKTHEGVLPEKPDWVIAKEKAAEEKKKKKKEKSDKASPAKPKTTAKQPKKK